MRVIHSLCEMDNMDWERHCQIIFIMKNAVLKYQSQY